MVPRLGLAKVRLNSIGSLVVLGRKQRCLSCPVAAVLNTRFFLRSIPSSVVRKVPDIEVASARAAAFNTTGKYCTYPRMSHDGVKVFFAGRSGRHLYVMTPRATWPMTALAGASALFGSCCCGDHDVSNSPPVRYLGTAIGGLPGSYRTLGLLGPRATLQALMQPRKYRMIL